jgi:hypothetical protein
MCVCVFCVFYLWWRLCSSPLCAVCAYLLVCGCVRVSCMCPSFPPPVPCFVLRGSEAI